MQWSDIGWIILSEMLSITTLLALAAGLLSKNLRVTLIIAVLMDTIGAVASYAQWAKHYPDQPEIIITIVSARVALLSAVTLSAYAFKIKLCSKRVDNL